MGKIACKCGYTIVDQSDRLSYKGDIIPDSGQEDIFGRLYDLIDSYTTAIENKQKEEWMKSNDLMPPYPQDLTASGMISDLFYNSYVDKTKTIFQCENCGRIFIQRDKSQEYILFKPETDDWKDALTIRESI